MTRWNSSPHPISDIRDWQEAGRLELRPDFQRREVWSSAAKIMLIDTILRGIPMPKVFLANTIRENRTYRVVIDGQQRLSAILAFMRDEFALDSPFVGEQLGKRFSGLDPSTRDRFLSYSIDFNEAQNPTDKEIREVYSRVNKYTVALNKQELRRADYPGAFLELSEELALDPRLDGFKIFTPADRRRSADIEYVSELLAVALQGIQNGKATLDDFYTRYSEWESGARGATGNEVQGVLAEITTIFEPTIGLANSRFRQKADFYSLFASILGYRRSGLTASGKELSPLRDDLKLLDNNIRPESDVALCREYAIKCVSQANSASSRKWRTNFITAILNGTYSRKSLGPELSEIYYSFEGDRMLLVGDGLNPSQRECAHCLGRINDENYLLAWPPEAKAHQFSNALRIHVSCKGDTDGFMILERPEPNGPLYFL